MPYKTENFHNLSNQQYFFTHYFLDSFKAFKRKNAQNKYKFLRESFVKINEKKRRTLLDISL